MSPLLAEVDLTSPTSILMAGVVAEAAAIAFLIVWIRGLYTELGTNHAAELKHRDDMLERVLTACSRMADAIELVTARGRKP